MAPDLGRLPAKSGLSVNISQIVSQRALWQTPTSGTLLAFSLPKTEKRFVLFHFYFGLDGKSEAPGITEATVCRRYDGALGRRFWEKALGDYPGFGVIICLSFLGGDTPDVIGDYKSPARRDSQMYMCIQRRGRCPIGHAQQ
ncbi:hypothetical protein NDU88_007688 [Pleurodeles waltl]|uniref:Uncharacterized protein n=1 Tax=Pleurodeles waltl TaxID=8319 RepID=A0AAV7U0F3_PLEWA|nr:hypothetical protein NDU88_007688 [Pleurodeles waltl]